MGVSQLEASPPILTFPRSRGKGSTQSAHGIVNMATDK